MPKKKYESPRISVLGSFATLTRHLDKVGTEPDFLSHMIPGLHGSIVPH